MTDAVIQAQGLGKDYGAVRALGALNLEVPRGALYGLLGPNGAGKSTTFGLFCGFLRPSRGSARVLGIPTDELHRLAGRVTALPQDASFSPHLPVGAQLSHLATLAGMTRAEAKREAMRVLELVGLPDVAHKRGRELSHGMHKRVGLAQALMGSPEIVFLDEPTAGLDPASAHATRELIKGLVPRATVVLSSHNLAEVQDVCTHAAILDHGRLVHAGEIATLTRRGTDVTLELAAPPAPELLQKLGNATLANPTTLRLVCPPSQELSAFIGQALRLLLDHNTPILGVTRGTTLEAAFLEATQAKQ